MIPDLKGFFIMLIVFGVLVGLLLAWGVPWLWGLIKPFLHMVTA